MKITDLLREQLSKLDGDAKKDIEKEASNSSTNPRLVLASLLEKTAELMEKGYDR